MTIVIDLAGVHAAHVDVRSSPIAESMALLHMLAEPDHHLSMSREIARVRDSIPADLARMLHTFAPLWARFRFRGLLPLTSGSAARDLADELLDMQSLSLPAFSAMISEALIGRRSPDLGDPTLDPDARRTLLLECRARSDERESLAVRFVNNPLAFRDELCRVLLRFHDEVFATTHAALLPRVMRSVELVRENFASLPVASAFAHSVPGTFAVGDRLSVAKVQSVQVAAHGRRFVLAPCVYASPHIVVKYDERYATMHDLPIVVQFPAIERTTKAPGLNQVLYRMSVLADPRRIDICRHLVNEPSTTVEISHRTGMSAPQVSRHLRRLRESGILISERDGRFVKHRLDVRAVYALGDDLLSRLLT